MIEFVMSRWWSGCHLSYLSIWYASYARAATRCNTLQDIYLYDTLHMREPARCRTSCYSIEWYVLFTWIACMSMLYNGMLCACSTNTHVRAHHTHTHCVPICMYYGGRLGWEGYQEQTRWPYPPNTPKSWLWSCRTSSWTAQKATVEISAAAPPACAQHDWFRFVTNLHWVCIEQQRR